MHVGVLASSAPDGGELIGEVDIVLPGEPGNLQVRANALGVQASARRECRPAGHSAAKLTAHRDQAPRNRPSFGAVIRISLVLRFVWILRRLLPEPSPAVATRRVDAATAPVFPFVFIQC